MAVKPEEVVPSCQVQVTEPAGDDGVRTAIKLKGLQDEIVTLIFGGGTVHAESQILFLILIVSDDAIHCVPQKLTLHQKYAAVVAVYEDVVAPPIRLPVMLRPELVNH